MRTLLIATLMMTSLSSFASMSDLAASAARNTDFKISQIEQTQNSEDELDIIAKNAAILTDLYFNCSPEGIENMATYNITANCEKIIKRAVEAGFSDDEIVDAITKERILDQTMSEM